MVITHPPTRATHPPAAQSPAPPPFLSSPLQLWAWPHALSLAAPPDTDGGSPHMEHTRLDTAALMPLASADSPPGTSDFTAIFAGGLQLAG